MTGATIPYLRDDSLPGTLAEFVQEFLRRRDCAALLRRWKYADRGFE